MTEKIKILGSLALLAALFGLVFWQVSRTDWRGGYRASLSQIDHREVISLNSDHSRSAYTQMAGLLTALAEIDDAEFAEDFDLIATIAAGEAIQLGQSPLQKDQGFLPPRYSEIAGQMRSGFENLGAVALAQDID